MTTTQNSGLIFKLAAPVAIAVIAVILFMPAAIEIAHGITGMAQNVGVMLSTGKAVN
jgi:hypothetical protein